MSKKRNNKIERWRIPVTPRSRRFSFSFFFFSLIFFCFCLFFSSYNNKRKNTTVFNAKKPISETSFSKLSCNIKNGDIKENRFMYQFKLTMPGFLFIIQYNKPPKITDSVIIVVFYNINFFLFFFFQNSYSYTF